MAIVTRSNTKAFEKLTLKIKQLDGIETKAGWFESAQYPDGTPVAYVAAIQELGSGKIPPRPFMRDAIAHDSQKWATTAQDGANAVINGNTSAINVMTILGEQAKASIQESITTLNDPPLSMLTIGIRAYKKLHPDAQITAATLGIVAGMLKEGKLDVNNVSDKPLNDTGHMLATVAAKTERV